VRKEGLEGLSPPERERKERRIQGNDDKERELEE